MKEKYFTIGEISEIKGITVKALRFYERIGLLKPIHKDPFTKYRYYSIDQFTQLDIIKTARSLGISLKDIKAILDKKDNKLLMEFLNSHKNQAIKQIEELQESIDMLTYIQNNVQASITSVQNTEVYIKDLPVRYIVKKELKSFKEEDIQIEYVNFYKWLESKYTNIYETGVLYSERQEAFYPTHIINILRKDVEVNDSDVTSIPAGKYICICMSKHNVSTQQEKFNTYLNQHNLKPSIILHLDLMNDIFDDNNVQIELQALV